MRKFFVLILLSIFSFSSQAQTYDERLAAAMNAGDWFALDSVYKAAPKDSVMPFLEVFSRALIGNRLNRPDVSIPAFEELFRSYSSYLDLNNLLNSAVMYSMDLSKVGDNAKASAVVTSMLEATRERLDSAAVYDMQRYIDRYSALSAYKPYTITFSGTQGRIPFHYLPVGNAKRQELLMQLDSCSINGKDANVVFDTGAGVNIISDSLATEYGLIRLEVHHTVLGVGRKVGQYAMAKEIKLGNIIVRDVPFLVVDLTLDNEEANRHIDCFSIVVGSELMLQLKDVTLDFVERVITVPSQSPERSGVSANMYFSNQMNLITNGQIHNNRMQICIDTGDASFGSLNGTFFNDNKDYVLAAAKPDTIRMAGIGGVRYMECYRLPDVTVRLGGNGVVVPQLMVNTDSNPLAPDYECNLGLKSLMQFGKIRFNLVDFTVTTFPVNASAGMPLSHRLPTYKFSVQKPSFLQTVGFVALSVANGLLNVNAPKAPDL